MRDQFGKRFTRTLSIVQTVTWGKQLGLLEVREVLIGKTTREEIHVVDPGSEPQQRRNPATPENAGVNEGPGVLFE